MLGKARWLKERTGRSGTRAEPGPRQATRACRPLAPRPAAVIGGCRDASTKNDGGTRNHGFSRSRPRATNAHADTSGPSPNAAATSRDAAAATQRTASLALVARSLALEWTSMGLGSR